MTHKILVDLKPAFDGFAGIPQETRLMFSGLRALKDLEVKGLIQHGGQRLGAGLSQGGNEASDAARIFRLSQFVVSVSARPLGSTREPWSQKVKRHLSLGLLEASVRLGRTVPHSVFDARLFGDFVWRTFFDKTLNASEKEAITGDEYIVVQPSRNQFHRIGLRSLGRRPVARYPMLDTRGFDFFIAQTPFPGRVSPGTQMVVRYHDAVPILMPHTISDKAFHQATHFHALRANASAGAIFSCVSEATRQDLLKILPEVAARSVVIHNIVSEEYHDDDQLPRSLVARVVRNRLANADEFKPSTALHNLVPDEFEYLLMVSSLEPRKNHLLLVSAWEQLKYGAYPGLKLIVVGGAGWDQQGMLKAFKPWAEKGELFYLQNVPSAQLRMLYRHAAATICPSLAEGFDYSGIEAMRCGCPVVSSDIAVHKEIYQDASTYFDPYSVDDAARGIGAVIASDATNLRATLRQRGLEVSQRYLPRNILPRWAAFFDSQSRSGK